MKLFKALLIFWLSATAAAASAQRAEDSLAITDGPWKVLIDEEGVLCKKLQTRVFDTLQRISVVEVDPSLYYPLLVQDTLIEKTSQMGVKNNGVAAINGGYFKTKTTRAEAADLIQINGKYPRQSRSGRRRRAPWASTRWACFISLTYRRPTRNGSTAFPAFCRRRPHADRERTNDRRKLVPRQASPLLHRR